MLASETIGLAFKIDGVKLTENSPLQLVGEYV